MKEEPSVRKLLEQVSGGDDSACESLIGMLGKELESVVRKRIGNLDWESVVQNVWLEVWKNAARIARDYDSPRAVILAIGWRRAVDHRRRNTKYKSVDPLILTEAEDRPLPVDEELSDAIDVFADTLPDREAHVFALKMAGRTHKEIMGEIGGLQEGELKRSLANVRSKLRVFLHEEFEVDV